MTEAEKILNSKITHLFIEFTDINHAENFSGKTFEIIVGLKKSDTIRFLRFVADNNIVEIKEQTQPKLDGNNVLDLVDFSNSEDFSQYVGKMIINIEIERYSDSEANGYLITLENNLQIEVYPNSYGTTGYFKDVKKYFPEKVKYLAQQIFYVNL